MLIGQQRAVHRGPVNPLDKSTIFSIYPEKIVVINHTVQPGRFELLPGTYDEPSSLVVGPSSWWRDIDEHQPALEIPHSSVQMAESIVTDWCNGIIECNMTDSVPGLFWIPGSISTTKLKTDYKALLDQAKQKQTNWFNKLVKLGDAYWARTNGNPVAISDQMRLAAKALNLTTKEWFNINQNVELVSCKACGNFVKSTVVVCPNCKVVINPEEFKKMNLQFAS